MRKPETREWLMVALVVVLVVCIVLRWDWIWSEIAGAFRERFSGK